MRYCRLHRPLAAPEPGFPGRPHVNLSSGGIALPDTRFAGQTKAGLGCNRLARAVETSFQAGTHPGGAASLRVRTRLGVSSEIIPSTPHWESARMDFASFTVHTRSFARVA